MKEPEKTIDVTFALLRAGLWNHDIQLLPYSPIDYSAVYQLADDQSVVGLVAAGLERVSDIKVQKPDALPFLKKVFSLEGRNASMNQFIENLVVKMRKAGIYALLIKGQGVAQCYERPQWRSSGDIDFLLDDRNYLKAKTFLLPLAESSNPEGVYQKHQGMTIDSWTVELHGTLRCGLSYRIDWGLDDIQDDIFKNAAVRAWRDGETDVFIPGQDEDIFIVFTHILKHFYRGGIGLRQICDWCRLLWTYRDTINVDLLKERLRSMGMRTEWRAFAAFAVEYLGMSTEAMPMYDPASKWKRKAKRIRRFILAVGNFGHNRDSSYFEKYPYFLRKIISLGRRLGDLCRHAFIFPLGSIRFLPGIVFHGMRAAMRGE